MAASASTLIVSAANAQSTYQVALPGGALSSTVRLLGSQTGTNILVDSSIGSLPTPALKGQMSVQDALDRVTKGQNVEVKVVNARSFLISRAHPLVKRTAAASAATVRTAPAASPTAQLELVEPTQTVGELVVTSSRIVRNGFAAPTPTTVVGAAEIEKVARVNIADYVNLLPQLSGSNTPLSTGTISGNLGGANVLNLRNLGAARTLVLVDGRRVVGATPTGVVDINLFPSALVSRVDIVTGGASAAWGSDAVSGVVNFVLDTKYVGLKGEISGGVTDYGDGANKKFTATYGATFGKGRGHVIGSVLLSHLDGIVPVSSRRWYNSTKMMPNPDWAQGNGQPYYIIRPYVGIASATDGGLITAVAGGAPASLVGTNFGPAGTTSRFVFGAATSGNMQVGGSYSADNDNAGKQSLLPSDQQGQAFLHGSYDFSSRLSAFAEFSYSRSVSAYYGASAPQGTSQTNAAITIRNDNAFLPAAIAAQMPAGSSFSFGRLNYDALLARPINKRETYRYVAGLSGELGDGWKWSGYAQYGKTNSDINVWNDAIPSRLPLAADAVFVTAANAGTSGLAVGSIACRSTLTNPTNGCVPENVFGYGSPSKTSLAWLTGRAHQLLTLKQQVYSTQINGTPFNTWAGPVAIAAGVDHRRESIVGDADPLSLTNSFNFGNYKPLAGKYQVTEGFAEAAIPLVKDAPLIKSADLDTAVRYTRYSVSGGVTTWKVGLNWEVAEGLRLRGTRSRDIRAPNLNELFQTGQNQQTNLADPARGNTSTSILATTKGNLDLTPEISESWGVGVVYRPSWIPGLGLSLDYYDISIKNAIATLPAATVVLYCFQGQSYYCSAVSRNPAGVLTGVVSQPFNANSETQKGFDFEASYNTSLDRVSLPGRLGLRLLANKVTERTITAGGVETNLRGMMASQGPARLRLLFTAGHSWGPSTLTFTARHIGSGVVDNTFVEGGNTRLLSIDNNQIKSTTTYDLSETIDLKSLTGRDLQLFFAVQNMTDTRPPIAVANNVNLAQLGTSQVVYDLIGRQYRGGIRFKF